MPNDDVTATAPPQLSPDGHWWWDGAAWIPAAERPGAPVVVAPEPVAVVPAVARPVAGAPVVGALGRSEAPPIVFEPVGAEPTDWPPVSAEPVAEEPDAVPEPDLVPEPIATEPAAAPAWAAPAPMPGNGIPHQPQPYAAQPLGAQPFPAQPFSPQPYTPVGYSLAAGQSPGKTLGIVSLVLSLAWVGGLGSLAAVITGHMSRSKDRQAGAPQSGLALAGLILGYLGVAMMAVIVLAAIAIPTFLDQKLQGQAAALTSELRSAAVVQESLLTDYGSYATSAGELAAGGYTAPDDIRLEVLAADAVSYCLGAVFPEVGDALYYDSTTGSVSATPCY